MQWIDKVSAYLLRKLEQAENSGAELEASYLETSLMGIEVCKRLGVDLQKRFVNEAE